MVAGKVTNTSAAEHLRIISSFVWSKLQVDLAS